MKSFISLFNTKVFKIGLLVALFITAAIIAIAMILGQEAGFFTIRVQNGDALKSITLALDPEDEVNYSTNFNAASIDDFDQTSPAYLFQSEGTKRFAKIMELHNGKAGDISFDKTYGYSFYIVNTTSNNTDVTVRLTLTMNKDDGLSDAIRIMTYYEANGYQYFTVYQKTDTESKVYNEYQEIEARNALKEFKQGQNEIFNDEEVMISGISGSNYLRYTILFWLEGEDPDCTEKILGKSAAFELRADVSGAGE
jgi:hypothetical protein